MMDTVTFENSAGEVFRLTDYGLLLVSFDAPEPETKTNRVSVEGADGDVDMTEWAGVIRYNTREVAIVIRDMAGQWAQKLTEFCHGRRMKIYHSADPARYYYGRCECQSKTRRRVTDVEIVATCDPYKMNAAPTIIQKTVSNAATFVVQSERKPVTPTVTVTAACVLTFGALTVTLEPGTGIVPGLVITDEPQPMTVTGNTVITLAWRDGVI